MELSVIIPTYNEKKNIGALIPRIQAATKGLDSEIIIVDDDSPDGTAAYSINLNKKYGNIVTIVRKSDRGLAPALIEGMSIASGRHILCMDADLVHDPKEIPRMLSHMQDHDVVIGSRYLKASRTRRPFVRNVVSLGGQYVQRGLLGLKVLDTTNNYRMFKSKVFESVKDKLHTDGNVMLFEFVYHAAKQGYRIKEIPIEYVERVVGQSKLSIPRETYQFIKRVVRLRLGR